MAEVKSLPGSAKTPEGSLRVNGRLTHLRDKVKALAAVFCDVFTGDPTSLAHNTTVLLAVCKVSGSVFQE